MTNWYVAVFEKSEDGFGVSFPGVPGCTSSGATVDEAAANAQDALDGHLNLTLEHGEEMPAPSTNLLSSPIDPEVQEVCRLLVGFEPAGRPC